MKRITLAVTSLLLLFTISAGAASPCPSGVPLSTYLAPGFSCTVEGQFVASNFTATPVAAQPNSPADPNFVTVLVISDVNGIGFHLSFPFTGPGSLIASGGQSDIEFSYTGTALAGFAFTGLYANISGKQINGPPNGSSGELLEDYCAGPTGGFNPPDSMCQANGGEPYAMLDVKVTTGSSNTKVTFQNPQTKLAVRKDLAAHGCAPSGWPCGTIQVTDLYNQVPGGGCLQPLIVRATDPIR